MQNFSDLVNGNLVEFGLEKDKKKCAFFNGKSAISRKRWEIRPRLLLVT